jgi:hypothetical protein
MIYGILLLRTVSVLYLVFTTLSCDIIGLDSRFLQPIIMYLSSIEIGNILAQGTSQVNEISVMAIGPNPE